MVVELLQTQKINKVYLLVLIFLFIASLSYSLISYPLGIIIIVGSSILLIFISSQLITLEEITYLPSLSTDEKLLVYGINFALVDISLGNLIKNRRRVVIKVK